MTTKQEDAGTWWQDNLENYKSDGRFDAEAGFYNPPHSDSDDPQDQDENEAYKKGFIERRKELGDAFKWFY